MLLSRSLAGWRGQYSITATTNRWTNVRKQWIGIFLSATKSFWSIQRGQERKSGEKSESRPCLGRRIIARIHGGGNRVVSVQGKAVSLRLLRCIKFSGRMSEMGQIPSP